MASPAPAARALNAILPLISSGQPYEAHQKARTFASRYIQSRQFDTAIQVLFQSAKELLKTGQQGSGTDLTTFLLDVYDKKGEEVNEESRGRITQLIALVGQDGGWRKTIIDKAIAWTAKKGSWKTGDPDLQHYVGELLYKEGAFVQAELHLLAAGKRDSGRVLAEMMVYWSAGTNPGLFALHGILPYLQNGNILAARTFIKHFTLSFTSKYPSFVSRDHGSLSIGSSDEIIVTSDPVLNFAQAIVVLCQRANGDKNKLMREYWVRLCGWYQPRCGILATKEIRKILNEIGELFFALRPPKGQQANQLADIMSALMGGGGPGPQSQPRVLTPASARAILD